MANLVLRVFQKDQLPVQGFPLRLQAGSRILSPIDKRLFRPNSHFVFFIALPLQRTRLEPDSPGQTSAAIHTADQENLTPRQATPHLTSIYDKPAEIQSSNKMEFHVIAIS
jgi:hypothetical protein